MKVKTYGVPGLTEWHGKVRAGSIEVAVSFTGGTASPSGAQPAYFLTKDPIVQFVIENCKEYKAGFIILVMSQEVPGEHPRMAVPKPKADTTPTEEPSIPDTQGEQGGEQPAEEQPRQEAGDAAGKGSPIEVADKSEAIEYLKEHFADKNYTATSLRTQTAFKAACEECGVEFVFTTA
jgi:hypothetical protein